MQGTGGLELSGKELSGKRWIHPKKLELSGKKSRRDFPHNSNPPVLGQTGSKRINPKMADLGSLRVMGVVVKITNSHDLKRLPTV